MVRSDHFADKTAQPVFTGKFQPLFDMTANDAAAALGRHFHILFRTVNIILHKISRHGKFADIVKQRSGFGFGGIGFDRPCGIFCKRGNCHGVEHCPRSLAFEFFQQRVVEIAQHHQRH